eukprot:10899157-Ditylum_brightwellii.AAC.1
MSHEQHQQPVDTNEIEVQLTNTYNTLSHNIFTITGSNLKKALPSILKSTTGNTILTAPRT